MQLNELDKRIIARLQGDIPLQPEPFVAVAAEIGIREEELLEKIDLYLEAGVLRRLGTILRHHKAGFHANAMCGWIVPEERVEEAGSVMATFKEASHVYLRPTYPDWPYNLFTMLHGKTNGDLEQTAEKIAEATGIREYKMLYSTREFKKTSMLYF
jgi:siroheme decarboxylase